MRIVDHHNDFRFLFILYAAFIHHRTQVIYNDVIIRANIASFLFYSETFFYGHRITWERLRHPGVTKTDNDIFLNIGITERRKNAVLNNDQYDDIMRKFISYVNNLHTSFRAYINDLRINEEKRLLLEKPDDLLGAIAIECGFANDSQFVRKFKEDTGMTPREWQSRNLQH